MTPYHEEKKRLLLELKKETLNQLKAVQAEDPDSFLQSTDICSSLMEALDSLHLQGALLTDDSRPQWKEVLQEILGIRQQISALIPALYAKLKQKADSEKQTNFVKQRYNQAAQPVLSIFLDKKI